MIVGSHLVFYVSLQEAPRLFVLDKTGLQHHLASGGITVFCDDDDVGGSVEKQNGGGKYSIQS